MSYELDRLRRWKKEAKQVFMEWEKVWEALGSPGILGQSKAVAAAEEVERMRLDRDDWKRRCTAANTEVEWLREAASLADSLRGDAHTMGSLAAERDASRTAHAALVAALRKAEAQVARMSLLTTAELVYVSSGELTARAEKAEARVAAVLALCDQADARLGQGNSLTPTAVRAAVDGAS